jgi:RHS repeat-associated protein
VFIYGTMGEKLSVLPSIGSIFGSSVSNNVYFSGRLIKQGTDLLSGGGDLGVDTNFVAVDRLGSVKGTYGGSGSAYLPYGEEVNLTSNDRMKFATYTRDASTGLDYADQRFYTSQFGRFNTPDLSGGDWDPANPGSWNLYAYVGNDPVNYNDPAGLEKCGDVPIQGGAFGGQTLSQVFTGTTGNDLLAQLVYNEAGAITNADIGSNFSGYLQELNGIASAVLNQVDVDDKKISVLGSNGQPVCPLGACLDRTLFQILTQTPLASDNSGQLFDASGHIRQSGANRINSVLSGDYFAGTLISDSGTPIGSNCEGLVASLATVSNLLTGSAARYSPNGATVLGWDMESPTTTTGTFGGGGYTGSQTGRPGGHTFWSLPSGPTPTQRRFPRRILK